jgi:hypothetical protein
VFSFYALSYSDTPLIDTLAEETHRRKSADERVLDLNEAAIEAKVQYELKTQNSLLEVKNLRAQLRALCDNQSLTDVFAAFEESVGRCLTPIKPIKTNSKTHKKP